MKRSGPPQRKTPLKRTEMKRGTSELKRTRLKPMSDQRKKDNRERAELLEDVLGPRPWRCQFWDYYMLVRIANPEAVLEALDGRTLVPGCMGDVNGHEVHKSGQGGSRTDAANIVPLCNCHNGYIEDEPNLGRLIGLVVNPNKGEELASATP